MTGLARFRQANWDRFAGMASAVGLLLLLAIISWTGVAGPLWRSYWTATPEQWLGFAGNVLGGLATLAAAIVAWFAVQAQVKEARRLAEQQRKDAANDKLTAHSSTIFIARSEQAQVLQASQTEREALYQRFEKYRVSPQVLAMLGDPLLGKDNAAVAFFMNALRNEAGGSVGRFSKDQVGQPGKAIERLHERLHEMISERRAIMARGSVDDLIDLKIIRLKPYRAMIKTGATFLFDDGTDD